MAIDDGVGPLDFLFCERCNKHLEERPGMDWEVQPLEPLSDADRQARICPTIYVKGFPVCPKCGSRVAQKYVSVSVVIPR